MNGEEPRERDVRDLRDDYALALRRYEAEGGEEWLHEAHEVGRRAMMLGMGILDLVTLHGEVAGRVQSARENDFLREALAQFEITHRGFAEANIELRKLTESLQRQVAERTEALRERQRLSEALNDINDLMRSSLDSEQIMSEVLAKGAETIGADSGSVAVAEGAEWVVRYVWRHDPEMVGRRFAHEENPWTVLAVQQGKPVVAYEDCEDSLDAICALAGTGMRSTLVASIVVRDRTLAVLHFNHGPQPHRFTEPETDFIEKLTASLSIALEDALSFEAEHRIAEVLQEAILETPLQMTGVKVGYCYASATEHARVGGDFYDLFQVQDQEVCAVIGDVSGKGIEAASLAAMAKNTIRMYAIPGRMPRDILRMTNESMYRFTAPGRFVTVFLTLLNLRTGAIRCGSAGHPPAILIRADGSCSVLDMHGAASPILAAFTGMTYVDRSFSLSRGDMLLLYTDGAIETRCGGKLLGEEGLLDLLQGDKRDDPMSLVSATLSDIKQCADGGLSDDIAMLALRLGDER